MGPMLLIQSPVRSSVPALFLLLGCALHVPRRSPPLPSPVVPEGVGVNIHFTDPRPGEMEMLAAAGFRWVRMDFAWESTEREKGKYDFTAYDRLMSALDKQHVRAMFILDYANRNYDRGLSPSSSEGREAMARWAVAAAKHFRGRGILWEMYNEPNIGFWKPKPDVDQYAAMALAVGRALHAAEPGETYIGPATSTIDSAFLESAFRQGCWSIGRQSRCIPIGKRVPRRRSPNTVRLRQLIDRYAPQGKRIPIISGEWGYSSAWNKYDETRQGKMLARQWLIDLAQDVPLSIWYDWHDDGQDAKEAEHHFGTVHFDYHPARQPVYDPKPAYLAAKTLTSLLAGFHFEKRLPQPSGDDYVYVFTDGKQQRFVVWTTSAKAHSVRIDIGAGPFGVTDHLGQALPEISGNGSVEITLTDGPRFLLPGGGR